MRTTLTLDDDLARELKERARRSGQSFRQVVNDAIRTGLRGLGKPAARAARFRVEARHCGDFRPGIDPLKLNQLVDELEAEHFALTTIRDRDT